ncbi:sensor histidine kinase [Halorientalis pallida]|uniref:histidine kinase n=1 Tax=Halorientalis pallida TaxID=2479928 RepID=A0A498KV84_9EURY|nr:PAS domain-containing sensor histidine kinase [Halorientalis pallida]RXK46402.1 PAS domain-containing sensor histidine kinase [Halorientalis pallida]
MTGEVDYRSLFEHAADALVVFDPDTGDVLDANERYCELVGYSTDRVDEVTLSDVTADGWEWPASPDELVDRAREEGPTTIEWYSQHRDGTPFWTEVALSIIESDDGEAVCARVRDVTERKDTEREATLYETIVENVSDGVYVFDTDGTIEYVNPRITAVTGIDRERWIGNTVRVFTEDGVAGEEPVAEFERAFEAFVESGDDRTQLDVESPTGIFDVIDIRLSAVRFGGELRKVVATVRDVSERVEHQRRLTERTEQLEVLNRVVRHDIRNDMTVVLAWLEALEAHVDDDDRDALERIERASEHVVELTEIARDHVDVVVGDGEVEPEPTDLADALETELEKRRESYPDATFEVDGELPDARVAADGMLPSVFRNLLNNAVQHNDGPSPTVSVSAERDGDTVCVRVTDDGPGVPDAQKETIFGKGEKGLDSPGSGIGLYLVYCLVEGYGGSVRVEDRADGESGAVFVVELPVAGA